MSLPYYYRYAKVSSCSDFKDCQSHKANIKFRDNPTGKAKLVRTLNDFGLAVGRCFASILENYQNEDGTVTVPEVPVSYIGTSLLNKDNSF